MLIVNESRGRDAGAPSKGGSNDRTKYNHYASRASLCTLRGRKFRRATVVAQYSEGLI